MPSPALLFRWRSGRAGLAAGVRAIQPQAAKQLLDRFWSTGPRGRQLALTIAASFVGRSTSFCVQFFQLPILVKAVGAERYGEAVATMAWLAMLPALDMGCGAALKNATADHLGRGQLAAVRRAAVGGLWWASGLAILLGGLVLVWPAVLRWVPGADAIVPLLEDDPATRVVGGVMVAAGLPLAMASHCADGLQWGWVVSLWRVVGAVVGLVVTVAVVAGGATARCHLVALLGLPAIVAGIGVSSAVSWRLRGMPPCGKGLPTERVLILHLIRDGLPFALPVVASLLVNHAPQVAIFAAVGPPAVARYAVGQRLMMLLLQPLSFAVAPLWPALAEARSAGDEAWVVRQVTRAWRMGLVYAVMATAAGAVCGREIAAIWIGGRETVPTASEMAAIAIATGISAMVQPGVMLLNAYRRLRVSIVVAILQVAVALAYKPLASLAGPAAVPAAQAMFNLFVVVPVILLDSRAALRR